MKLNVFIFKSIYIVKVILSICQRCDSSYIDKTCRHFKTRIDENVRKDKYLQAPKNNDKCFSSFISDGFFISVYAPTHFQVKIKGGIYTDWKKPKLN